MGRYTEEVRIERARLAVLDPAGEADAIAPLTQAQAWAILEKAARYEEAEQARRIRQPIPRRDDTGAWNERFGFALGIANVRGMVLCPAHEDRMKSLSYRWEADKLLVKCHAGCTFDEIRVSVGL